MDMFQQNFPDIKPGNSHRCMLTLHKNGKLEITIVAYVDEILLMVIDSRIIYMTKEILKSRFHIKGFGIAKWHLGPNIVDNPVGISISQSQ